MAEKLTVSIGADISDLQKGISQAEKEIQDLKKIKADNIKIGADTSQINTAIDQAKAKLAGLQKSATGAGTAMQGFQKQTANGGVALTAFSRIAQDAPYGIIGVGNNITQAGEQFQYLTKQTGSASGALKAMLGSLAGIGGVMLGVSLLITGLTVMAQKGITVGDVIDKLTGRFDAFKDSMNKLAVEQAKNSGSEIANMNALVSVAQNDLKSKKDRLTAVEELQNQFPAYFGNLDKEKILTGDLSTVTKELTKAIIARAEASAISEKIGELAAKKLDAQIKREKAIIQLQKAQQGSKIQISSGGTLGADANISNQTRLARATSNVKDLNQEIADIQAEQNKLASMQNLKTAESIKLLEKKAKVPKASKPIGSTPQVAGLQSSLQPSGLAEIKAPKITGIENIFPSGSIVAPMTEEFRRGLELMMQFNEDVNSLIEGSIMGTFDRLGTAIGEALATGGNVLQSIGQTLLQSLGAFLSDLGGMLIKYGTLAVLKGKLDLAILTGGPVSIAAGFAAIAVGIALKAAAGAIGAAARGGASSSRSGAGGSSSNYSTSTGGFSTAGAGGGTVVFEIAGQKLIGVLSNTLNSNRRLGGTNLVIG